MGASTSRQQPLVKVNCPGIPSQLFESELFGHMKGSFTGAYESRKGKFELAGNGNILLDEISEIPLELQAKLLRVLEERRFTRVWVDQREVKVEARGDCRQQSGYQGDGRRWAVFGQTCTIV